jgi:hypothetical protein
VSSIKHYVTRNGDPIVVVTIGPKHESFGICYECKDGYHGNCVGVPCECWPCPPKAEG